MTKKQLMWLAITLGVIAFAAVVAAVYFAWPKPTSATVPPAGQAPTATSLPTITMVEATVTPMVSTEPTSTAVAETAAACCETVAIDLQTSAPEGVWSNASGIRIPEGWCVVLQRDQLWQQSRDEAELRLTWDQGATEDYLLLCNSHPGARYYSLEEEYGGRPRDWWNDQIKRIWAFPDPQAAGCRPGIVVLYENDDSNDLGWSFEIPVGAVD